MLQLLGHRDRAVGEAKGALLDPLEDRAKPGRPVDRVRELGHRLFQSQDHRRAQELRDGGGEHEEVGHRVRLHDGVRTTEMPRRQRRSGESEEPEVVGDVTKRRRAAVLCGETRDLHAVDDDPPGSLRVSHAQNLDVEARGDERLRFALDRRLVLVHLANDADARHKSAVELREPLRRARPRVPRLHQVPARGTEGDAASGIGEQRHDGGGKGVGLVANQEMLAVVDVDSLTAECRRHHRPAHRKPLDDLEARPAADADRHDDHGRPGEVGPHVGHLPGHLHARMLAQALEIGACAPPDDRQSCARHDRLYPRQDLVDEKQRCIEVRAVVEHAVEHERVRLDLVGRRAEVVDVDAVRHDRTRRRRSVGADDFLLPHRRHDAAVHAAPELLLEWPETGMLAPVERAPRTRAFARLHPAEYLVLDVVLVEYQARFAREAQASQKARLDLDDVEAAFGRIDRQRRPQPSAETRRTRWLQSRGAFV